MVGSKSVGKSTVLYSFLEKPDTPRETLVLDYSFGRKSNQKQGLEKSICHVWEYGGKLNILKNVLSTVPISGKFYYCIMIDLSKVKRIWNTLETCIQAMTEVFTDSENLPELIILCGKYDLFKNYDSEIKKFICTTIRSVALLHDAHLLFYSSKEPQLARRAKELFYGIGFGNGVLFKERNSNFIKPMVIPRNTDSWEHIGVAKCTLEQVKARHISRIASEPDLLAEATSTTLQRSHPEPVLDSLAALKYDELRNLEFQDISVNEYLRAMH
ncbi:cytoplasmic dynein 2 light intermediate chain 1 [Pectinophora gossypiella]|uniref:cytoplasmic dynein 2 light intermediate chain 1 n=1 Tax=Pectinophora gossypiella TaxID=13191 RepID=UPI00214E991E|nr:cytoplasmic dynein 2 light intermediate chain 1 [Pectinophora gossypiella]